MKIFLAVNKSGSERGFVKEPVRDAMIIEKRKLPPEQWSKPPFEICSYWTLPNILGGRVVFKDGSIEKLLGHKMSWEDEPVQVDLTDSQIEELT